MLTVCLRRIAFIIILLLLLYFLFDTSFNRSGFLPANVFFFVFQDLSIKSRLDELLNVYGLVIRDDDRSG